MKDWRTATSGNFLRWRGVVWVINLNLNRVLHLEDFETGETRRMSLADWQQGCFDGKVEMLQHPTEGIPADRQALAELTFSAMPPSMQAAVHRMRPYIEAYLDPAAFYATRMPELPPERRRLPNRRSRAKVLPLLMDVASTFEPADKVPGFTTFLDWLDLWERYRSWTMIAPRFDKRGSSDRTVIVGPLKKIVDRSIREFWMRRGQRTKKAVCDAIKLAVLNYNDRHPYEPIGVSDRQVCRYIDEAVDKYEEAVAHKGKRSADFRFRPVFKGPGADRIMQVLEVDHTQAKTDVTDDETGRNLGRPWVTAALDRHSRMPVGLHVHFEGQTLHAVMQCLRNALMPKTFLKTLVPELDYHYPCCGVPEALFFDRGPDFDNDHVREVSLNLDVVMRYEPGENPEYKGAIERFFGTLHRQVALPLKGAMPRVKDRDDDRRPRKSEATMPFSDFYARLWHWVAMVYAKDFHEGLAGVPLTAWNESAEVRQPRPPPKKAKLDTYLMRTVRCEPTVNGVRHQGLVWNGDAIKAIRSHPGHRRGAQVLVRIDDGDLGRAFVTDPVTGTLRPLEPVLDKYMPGTSMHQHQLVLREVGKKREGTHRERSLLEAKRRMHEEALATHSMKTTGSKTQARIAKFLSIGAIAPSGEELGCLDPRGAVTANAKPRKLAAGKVVVGPARRERVNAAAPPRMPPPQAAPVSRRAGPARRLGA